MAGHGSPWIGQRPHILGSRAVVEATGRAPVMDAARFVNRTADMWYNGEPVPKLIDYALTRMVLRQARANGSGDFSGF
jgi:hypothetical protein